MKFKTTITDIIKRTPDITSFRFARPEGLQYEPGQFFVVALRHGGAELKKHFSFSSSPTEKNHIEFTKKLSDSDYSAALRDSKVGDWAGIDAPYGKFTFTGEYPKIALLGGGIGITPFMSIIKYATDMDLKSQITLFYACSTPEEIVFRKEFLECANKNSNLKIHFTVSKPSAEWKGATGRINEEMIRQELPNFEEYVFYACGPPPMVKAMQELVENLGLPKEKLKLELFTGYL